MIRILGLFSPAWPRPGRPKRIAGRLRCAMQSASLATGAGSARPAPLGTQVLDELADRRPK